jgi:hypothetical protein
MNSADDLIGATEMTPAEAAYIHGRLLISTTDPEFGVTINRFSNEYGLMPMLVARTLADIRPSDSNLNSLISTNEFLIKTFGKNRVSRDAVEDFGEITIPLVFTNRETCFMLMTIILGCRTSRS